MSMPVLSDHAIRSLLQTVHHTPPADYSCGYCENAIASFAESTLRDMTQAEALVTIEEHLQVCLECRFCFEALRDAVRELEDDPDNELTR